MESPDFDRCSTLKTHIIEWKHSADVCAGRGDGLLAQLRGVVEAGAAQCHQHNGVAEIHFHYLL